MADVDDEIALGEVKEAVDRPRFQAPARRFRCGVGGRIESRLAAKQLLAAENDDTAALQRVDHAKAGPHSANRQMKVARLGQPPLGQNFTESMSFCLAGTGDEHLIGRGDGIQFVANLGHFATEPLDRFDAKLADRLR